MRHRAAGCLSCRMSHRARRSGQRRHLGRSCMTPGPFIRQPSVERDGTAVRRIRGRLDRRREERAQADRFIARARSEVPDRCLDGASAQRGRRRSRYCRGCETVRPCIQRKAGSDLDLDGNAYARLRCVRPLTGLAHSSTRVLRTARKTGAALRQRRHAERHAARLRRDGAGHHGQGRGDGARRAPRLRDRDRPRRRARQEGRAVPRHG